MERRLGAVFFSRSSRPVKVSPLPPRSKTKHIRSTISFLISRTFERVRALPEKKRRSVVGSAFFVSKRMVGPIIPATSRWACPSQYGSGASEVIRELVANPSNRYRMTNESLRHGDIERALMEWRSLLRHIVGAPILDWDRWTALQKAAEHLIGHTTSPALIQFPPLLASQQSR